MDDVVVWNGMDNDTKYIHHLGRLHGRFAVSRALSGRGLKSPL